MQNLQKNTCFGVFFYLSKRDSSTGVFLWKLQKKFRTLTLKNICEWLLLKGSYLQFNNVVLCSSELNLDHYCTNETKAGSNRSTWFFFWKNSASIEYFSQIKHIAHASSGHVTLNRFFLLCPAKQKRRTSRASFTKVLIFWRISVILIILMYFYNNSNAPFLFYKNSFYKNHKAENHPKIKNFVRITPGSRSRNL